ncbi:hypothetical protein SLEP1_g52241 [Rubroshorea leprosula]|uniref:Ankyrin repeat domain-containing protein, chloroplastic n=1 Tax=Rubroshorea leprosula TaxID=152421 RepID=A0AAV5M5R9_9ROSI|nr:hypothetical protein SLEP1_g52241 [Rubroshorea leprosula]
MLLSSSLLNPSTPKLPSFPSFPIPNNPIFSVPPKLHFPTKFYSFSPSFLSSHTFPPNDDVDGEDHVVGDCLVFEDGAFEDPYLQSDFKFHNPETKIKSSKTKSRKKKLTEIKPENLVPEQWKHVLDEVNITKKERRKIAQQLEFGSRVEKKRRGMVPIRNVNVQEYLKSKAEKVAQLNPVVLDNPSSFPVEEERKDSVATEDEMDGQSSSSERLASKNPRWAVYGKGFEYVNQVFNSGIYQPGDKKSDGTRKLFTKEEKVMLNMRVPDVAAATSRKWLPLHTLAAAGEFYLVDSLLKHNIDINAMDKDGLTALHKAIIGKRQAITNFLLRESANPFVLDEDGATLMHYAVQTASSPIIKLLLLYNVNINLQDNDGWTPLHLAVQARRTDIVKLLLIKGADKTLRNKDGLTPLHLCLYSGHDTRTYELIKLLKELPRSHRATLKN